MDPRKSPSGCSSSTTQNGSDVADETVTLPLPLYHKDDDDDCSSIATTILDPDNCIIAAMPPLRRLSAAIFEIPPRVQRSLKAHGLLVDTQGLVTFAPNSNSHPRNWRVWRKSYDSTLIIFLEFFMTLISNAGTATAEAGKEELGLTTTEAIACFITVYMLGQAIGGLIFPPMSESFGAKQIYTATTAGFGLMCLLIAVVPALPMVIIGRFVSGILSAMPAVVACGSLENMWDAKARIWVIHLWICGAVLGLTLAPVTATAICSSSYGWPFVYGIAACVCVVCAFLCLLMQESRPSKVLDARVQKIVKRHKFRHLRTSLRKGSTFRIRFAEFVRDSLAMPVRLFCGEIIVTLVSFMAAFVYGIVYLFSEALAIVYASSTGFGFTPLQSSLVILAMAVAIPFTFIMRLWDIKKANRIQEAGREMEPEDKLTGFYWAAPVLALALWWFAVTVPPLVPNSTTPWLSIAALVPIGYGVVEFDTVLSGYLTDSYNSHAASANGPMGFLRCILSGVFPLFGSQIFEGMGPNNALFLLAALATSFCGAAVCFKIWGKTLRRHSKFAEKERMEALGVSEETLVGTASIKAEGA